MERKYACYLITVLWPSCSIWLSKPMSKDRLGVDRLAKIGWEGSERAGMVFNLSLVRNRVQKSDSFGLV